MPEGARKRYKIGDRAFDTRRFRFGSAIMPRTPPGVLSLPDTFFYTRVMKEKRTYLGQGGEEENTRSSVQTEKLQLFGGRPQWMHLVYSG